MAKDKSRVLSSRNLGVMVAAAPPIARVQPPSFTTVTPPPASAGPGVKVGPPPVATVLVAPPTIVQAPPVPTVGPMLTMRMDQMRFIDPGLATAIIGIRTPTEGVPRAQIKVPISPNENVTNGLIFESVSDPSTKFYIPSYRVMTQVVAGKQRYQVALQQSGQEWTLTVRLEKYRAPAIANVAPEATPMEHRIAVILKHNQLAGGHAVGQEELEFKEKTEEADGIRAVLRGNTLAELDLIYQTLTDPTYGATLIVRTWVTVGIPLTAIPPQETMGVVRIHQRPMIAQAVRRPGIAQPGKPRPTGRPRPPGKPRPVRPRPPATPEPRSTPPPQPLFRQVDRVIDDVISPNPFVFPPALHSYMFGTVTAKPGEQFELVRHQVSWKGRMHSYYQNPIRSYQFYYLPDAFKITRRPNSPYEPVISVRFAATDASLDKVQVAMDYIALPFVDANRLAGAVEELRKKVSGPLPPGVNTLSYEPLLNPTDKTHLRVAIPRSDASSAFDDRKDALVDLRSGIHDSLPMLMPQFQAVYDAMFGSANILLSGTVTMDLGGDQESIPFTARMNDLIGRVFDYSETKSPDGGVNATFRNAIESPVMIRRLSATLNRNLETFPATIRGLDLSTPIRLEPNQQLSFQVVPVSPIPGDSAATASFDLDGVEVIPDKEAIWNAILDPSAPGVYMRTIKVKTFKPQFDPPRDQPEKQIMSIVVDFEGGTAVELSADHPEQEVSLRLPIGDYVLRKANLGQYRYKVRVIRLSAIAADKDWKTDDTGILFPLVS